MKLLLVAWLTVLWTEGVFAGGELRPPAPSTAAPGEGAADPSLPSRDTLPPSQDLTPRDSAVRPGSYGIHVLHYLGSGSLTTGHVAWTPLFRLFGAPFRGELGFALPKNALGDLFLAFNYELLFRFALGGDFSGEAGGGLQTFTAGNGGTAPLLSAAVAWSPWRDFVIDRFVLSYSRYFRTGAGLHQLKWGVALGF